jgi:hypothetical protein
MAKTKISEYSATPADNTDISNINIAEGCSPANVNNAIRSLMAQIKDLQAGTSGDTIPITAGGTGAANATTARSNLGVPAIPAAGITKSSGTALSAATAGTDYVEPATATTFTATQTFTGSTTAIAAVFQDAAEVTTVSATAATGTINYDVTSQAVLYYTSNASDNWTVNFRGNGTTSLNTLMSTGQAITVVFMVTQGSTAYYNNAVTIDGTSVTPKWQNASTPSAGNASGIDIYSYTIIKTASATYTVLASQIQFA